MKHEKPEVTVQTLALSAIQTASVKEPQNNEDSEPNTHLSISAYEDNE